MQAHDWPFSGMGFDRQDVEATTGGIDPARTKELASHAGEVASFVGVDGVFGSRLLVGRRASFYFYESQGATVVADEIDFTFDSGHGVIAATSV